MTDSLRTDQPQLAHASLPPEAAATLLSMLRRLIPTDELGPGADEAGVLDFIDSELSGSLRARREVYLSGLDELDRIADQRCGDAFLALAPSLQDEIIREIATLDPDGERAAMRGFFEQVLGDCIDGFLSDPLYGGNRDGIGWKLIGYPGPTLVWTEAEQQLDHVVPFRDSSVLDLPRKGTDV